MLRQEGNFYFINGQNSQNILTLTYKTVCFQLNQVIPVVGTYHKYFLMFCIKIY